MIYKILTRRLSNLSNSHESNLKLLKSLFEKHNKPNKYEKLLKQHSDFGRLKKAAVLVPISIKEEKCSNGTVNYSTYYTFTKRTPNMKFYGGQTCFMGGKMDEADESVVETALREAYEEVNIPRDKLTLLAQLYPLITTNVGRDSFLLFPIVYFYDNKNFTPILNQNEVECLYEIPTRRFLSKEGHELNHVELNNEEYYMHYFSTDLNGVEVDVWGITSLISILVSSILHQRPPDFLVDPLIEMDPQNMNKFFDEFVLKRSIKLIDTFEQSNTKNK